MKQVITTKSKFVSMDEDDKFMLLHNTEFRVQRLERIIGDLMTWKEGSRFYKEALAEYNKYVSGE